MKKVIILILVVVVAAAVIFSLRTRRPSESESHSDKAASSATVESTEFNSAELGQSGQQADPDLADLDDDDLIDFDERKASEVYSSASDALVAIKKAALEYDDLVLEQFSNISEGCGWCSDFYASVKDLMLSPETSPDQRSYYAEVLAVSGDNDNIKTLVDATLNAPSSEHAEIFAEALELAYLDENGLMLLKEQFDSGNPIMKEATVAAFTNQGSRLAVETLFEQVIKAGDPDGFYSQGIGPGEVIPDPESLPLLQEIMTKRDQFSHLAVKSLLNAGLPGLMVVFDGLNSSNDPDFDRQNLLKDAIDHVSYDEQTEQYLQQQVQSAKNPAAIEFAKEILEDFKEADDFEDDFEDELEGQLEDEF